MKGATNIEFVLAVFVFLGTLSFISLLVVNNLPLYRQSSLGEDIKAETYQISELLLFDKGEPENWSTDNVKRIGLMGREPYIINPTKITRLGTLCADNYEKAKNLLGVNDFEINISYLDGTTLALCKNLESSSRIKFTVTRFGAEGTTSNILKIQVSVFE